MIRAVIDTNVFVSGIFWSGPPSQVLEAWSKNAFKMIVSSDILAEYERVLTSLAKKANYNSYERLFELVKLRAEVVTPIPFARPICRDKDDDKFLSAAFGGGASVIVTGDDDLLVLDGYQNLRTIKPKLFLNSLSKRQL